MKVSIAITNHNDGSLLWKTVRSCLESSGGLKLEIVVADDASTDGSIAELLRRYPKVRVIRHRERRGVSQTKDAAIRATKGDVFVLLDGHCKPEEGAIARLAKDLEELDGQAVLMPRIPSLDERRWQNRITYVGYGFGFDLKTFHCEWLHRRKLSMLGKYFVTPGLVGCCVAMSRDLYEKLWGFDQGMREYGLEDIDFGLKAWLLGHKVLVDPEAAIGHRFRTTRPDYSIAPESVLMNQMRMARKNFSDLVWREWLDAFRARILRRSRKRWEGAQHLFEAGHETLEREREYLRSRRVHSEHWYATRFGLDWPRR